MEELWATVAAEDVASRAGVIVTTRDKSSPNQNRIAWDALLDRMADHVPTPDTGAIRVACHEQLKWAKPFDKSPRERMSSQFIVPAVWMSWE